MYPYLATSSLHGSAHWPAWIGPLIIVLAIWSIIWKGLALWRAGRNNQLAWFVVMLILNTVGILEIIYLIWFAKPKQVQPQS